MNLDLTDDQEALRGALREFFDKESPPEVVRAAEPLGFDAALWRKVVGLGLPAIAVPEERGGGGSGFVELAIAAELVGRSLAPVPLIEAAVATALLASLPGEAASAAVAGELLATTALHPAAGDVARLVPAGAVADLVVVLRGEELLAVRTTGGPAEAVPNLGAMPIADCRLDSGEVTVLARGAQAVAAHRRAVRHWELLTGAALVGIASRALELGIDYVLERRAFGVPIAGFQTVQHRLADNATALEGARLLAYKAAWAHDAGLPSAGTLATMSLLFASETAVKTASDSLHFHGGYGYTLEYDVQLYFRRAKAWPLVAGDRRAAYAELPHRLFDVTEG
ncbi:acyl-CoA dehydrogenase family protein [Thermomonospora cellulosilytica]|uniref:Alkylation response protein AidB-like acyl-CoA dehydrogenase n=1 Tax=Thermomonospora cellulosilytica TaxID=1411118 RepID=A0A7W3N0M4_9ACTN|nr:acyl-CoA dehydrogenase family protein [Thermomonospora cellulosilytica]MBA9005349.1 alkylation response protein AidB-like acyl-CoA dehydrogenase [Thermomonospora cellulosilytica]